MSGELNDISRVVGGIESDVRGLVKQFSDFLDKQDKFSEMVIEQRGAIKLLGTQFSEHISDDKAVKEVVIAMKEEFAAVKNQGKGALFGMGLAGGGVGAGIATLLARWLGNGPPPLPPGHGG